MCAILTQQIYWNKNKKVSKANNSQSYFVSKIYEIDLGCVWGGDPPCVSIKVWLGHVKLPDEACTLSAQLQWSKSGKMERNVRI